MKHFLQISSIHSLLLVLLLFIFTKPVLLFSQFSQDTIKFKIETKRGVSFIGASLDYIFFDGTNYTLDGQLESDSLGIIWFIYPGDDIIDKLLLKVNATEGIETGVDFADIEIARNKILGIDIDCQRIMDYLISNEDFFNGLTTLDFVLMVKSLLYDIELPYYLGNFKFYNKNSDVPVDYWVPFNGNFSTYSINEILGFYELDFNGTIFYSPPISTPNLEISVENRYIQPGDTIQVMFQADSTIDFNNYQFCLRHEGLNIINTDNPFYQYDSVLTRVYFENYLSNNSILFESTIEGMLEVILRLDHCKMKNQYYYGDCYDPGHIKLVFEEFSSLEGAFTKDNCFAYPNPAKNSVFVCLPKGQKGLDWTIYSINGNEMSTGKINKTNAFYIDNLQHLSRGLYLLRCKTLSGVYINLRIYVQ
jgi:hypothetical protein